MNAHNAKTSPLSLATLIRTAIFLTRLSADATTKADAVIITHRKNILQTILKKSKSFIQEVHLLL